MNMIEVKDIDRVKELVTILNKHRDAYYNKQQPTISDKEYDDLFDELTLLEKKTGMILSNSPSQTVGYEVKSELSKVVHNHLMLSLDKTKSVEDLVKFLNNKGGIAMLKMDGLTISLRYLNGELVSAETRGNGESGEDILHNAKVFKNIPLHIDFKDELIVDGEAIITYDTFDKINSKLSEDDKYKNPRNLASGSVRQLDSKIASERGIKFIAWKMVKGNDYNSFANRLSMLSSLGFDIVPFYYVPSDTGDAKTTIEMFINILKKEASDKGYPIDGMVIGYDDVSYGESLGATSHHLRSQIAYKFYDEEVETTLKNIEFTMGKTGVLTPVAIFEPVEIDGTTIEKASVHNISILTKLDLHIGDTIEIYKANQIIPQIKRNISGDKRMALHKETDYIVIPPTCPVCGGYTEIKRNNDSDVLICTNDNCKGKLLGKLTHFVSKNAMNIDGMSEATLEFLIERDWVKSFRDIYKLDYYRQPWKEYDGFGDKSVDKLLDSIEASKHTTLDRFIYSLSIPLIGRSASKAISKACEGNLDSFRIIMDLEGEYAFSSLDGFGREMGKSLRSWWCDNKDMFYELSKYLTFESQKVTSNTNLLNGKTFVITGSLYTFENRDVAKDKIEALGGKVSGSVSKKTSYLVNNDITSISGKNKKAKELGIPIITEDELIKMLE